MRWAEQQKVKRRVKRDFLASDPSAAAAPPDAAASEGRHRRASGQAGWSAWMNDPKWPEMWYLVSSPCKKIILRH